MQPIEKVKYLIVGQGLVGTWMSYHLDRAGIDYKVVSDSTIQSATSVASGVINPVTGRRIVQTWMIETLLPYAVAQYNAIASKLAINIIKSAPVILLHPSSQMKDSFDYRMAHENVFLFQQDSSIWKPFFNTTHGTGAIKDCYWMDLNKMTSHWKAYLMQKGNFIEEYFDCNEMVLNENGVRWKNMEANKIIFCDGVHAMENAYFKSLPFAPNKGEALIIKVPGLPNENIYKNNISIVPWDGDLFWVGSSYEWSFENNQPTSNFKEKMIHNLNQFLTLPYEVVDHISGIRPANTQRRPFVGVHPFYPQLAICNGMGTKGCSLSPYFTNALMEHLENGMPIEAEANVTRFDAVLKNASSYHSKLI